MADRKLHVLRGRDLAEFSVVSSALALVTNIVMAYNAGQLQKSIVRRLAASHHSKRFLLKSGINPSSASSRIRMLSAAVCRVLLDLPPE